MVTCTCEQDRSDIDFRCMLLWLGLVLMATPGAEHPSKNVGIGCWQSIRQVAHERPTPKPEKINVLPPHDTSWAKASQMVVGIEALL